MLIKTFTPPNVARAHGKLQVLSGYLDRAFQEFSIEVRIQMRSEGPRAGSLWQCLDCSSCSIFTRGWRSGGVGHRGKSGFCCSCSGDYPSFDQKLGQPVLFFC